MVCGCGLQGVLCEGQELQVTLSRNKEVRLPSSTAAAAAAAAAAGDAAAVEDEKRTVAFTMKDQRYGVS